MIPRTRTSLLAASCWWELSHITHLTHIQYTHLKHHHTTTKLQNTEKYEFSGPLLTPPQKHHHKNTTTSPHQHNLAKQRKARVLGPDVDTTTPPPQNHHHTTTTTKNISSWAGWCRTPKSTKITTKNEHQFLGRMLQNTEKYKNYHEKWTSVLGPDVAEHRKVRKLPRKMNISSWAGCCGTPKSTKITTKTRLQFLGRMLQRQKRQKSTSFIYCKKPRSRALQNTEKYENYHEKWTWKKLKSRKSTKIYRQNPF